jgi:hypothetical protein
MILILPTKTRLEQFQEKWIPLFRPKLRKPKKSKAVPNSVKSGIASKAGPGRSAPAF